MLMQSRRCQVARASLFLRRDSVAPSQYRQRHVESGVLQNLMTVSWTCFLKRLDFGLKRVELCGEALIDFIGNHSGCHGWNVQKSTRELSSFGIITVIPSDRQQRKAVLAGEEQLYCLNRFD